jgi:hypothetical protein
MKTWLAGEEHLSHQVSGTVQVARQDHGCRHQIEPVICLAQTQGFIDVSDHGLSVDQ